MTDTGPALAGVEATAAEHGTKAANERALAALPMAGPPPVPGGRGGFLRPTERSNEPVTAGLSTGPGPGPSGMSLSEADQVRAIYRAYPSEELRRIVEFLDRTGL